MKDNNILSLLALQHWQQESIIGHAGLHIFFKDNTHPNFGWWEIPMISCARLHQVANRSVPPPSNQLVHLLLRYPAFTLTRIPEI